MNVEIIFVGIPVFGAIISYFSGRHSTAVMSLFGIITAALGYIYPYGTLSWIFLFMVDTVFLSAAIFSINFVKNRPNGFSALMLLSLAGANGVILSKDFVSFFIFWEVMSWSSYLLVFRTSGENAKYYFIFGALSSYLILWGIGIYYSITGSIYFSSSSLVNQDEWLLILIPLISGFCVKAAVVPLHIWAPRAYSSEESFSSFLAGGLSKLGVYGIFISIYAIAGVSFLKNFGVYRGIYIFGYPLALIGAITAFVGTLAAIFQDDLRKLLAYSSIGQIGYIMVGLGIGTPLAVGGAIFQAINHTFFKAILFLAAGAVFYRTGKRKISEMGGLGYKMPFTFLFTLFAIFALAGIPITSGFISKWMIYSASIERKLVIVAPLLLISSVGAFLYSYRILYGVFLGYLRKEYGDVKEVPPHMLAAMGILTIPLIIFAIFPGIILDKINEILYYFGLEEIPHDTFSINSSIGTVNMLVFFLVFMAAFLVSMIMFMRKRVVTVEQMDNYFAGETPEVIEMHAAYKYYAPLRKVFKKFVETSAEKIYEKISSAIMNFLGYLRKVYTGDYRDYSMYIMIVFAIIFLARWLL